MVFSNPVIRSIVTGCKSIKKSSVHHLSHSLASIFLLLIQYIIVFIVVYKLFQFGQWFLKAACSVLVTCPQQSLSTSLLSAQAVPAHLVLSLSQT
jgi:hypothetical protein